MYYVRKLNNRTNSYKIKEMKKVREIQSDFLRQEMGTQGNTLSFWKCSDLNDLKDTIKAIILSTTEIKLSEFVLLDSELVKEKGLEIDEEEAGKTGYKGFSNLHINIKNLTYEKIGDLLDVYKITLDNATKEYVYKKDDIKELINQVIQDDLLDEEKVHPDLLKDIYKYCNIE